MKKLSVVLLVLVMCFSLVACGGPDKQPAIDAYNTLAENYNAFVDVANEDLDSFSAEEVEFLNNVATTITEYGEKLDGDYEFTQEELDEMVEKFTSFNATIEEVMANYQ